MDFIISLFFILIMIIFSGVFRTLLSKKIKKNTEQSPSIDEDEGFNYNDNTSYEKEAIKDEKKSSDIMELFEEYSLKQKKEVYNKDTYINRNTLSQNDREKAEKRRREKEEIIRKRNLKQKEKIQSQERKILDSLNKNIQEQDYDSSFKKEPALDRIKKLSYFKQAIVLSEILGPPKGLDL